MLEIILIAVILMALSFVILGFSRNAPTWIVAGAILFLVLAGAINADGIQTEKYENVTQTSYFDGDGNVTKYDFNFVSASPSNDASTAAFSFLIIGIALVLLMAAMVMYMRGSGVAR